MTEPISVRVDLEVPAAYVKFSKTTSVETRDIVDVALWRTFSTAPARVGLEV